MSPSPLSAVRSAVRDALDRAGVGASDAVVVACSGGADSSVLADVALRLAADAALGPVTLVYIDHGLRPNTAADAAVVQSLAEHGGGQFRAIPVEVDRTRASLEDAARRARYPALERAADEVGASWIFTAHTASDQAETVLLRLVRGTGVSGLAAIPRRRGRIVRPLLSVSRAVILAYREARDLAAITDPTNAELGFTRNRIRHQILPSLERENPRIESALCRLASAAAEQRDVLDYAAEALLCRGASSDGRLDTAILRAAPPAVAKRALAIVAESLGSASLGSASLGSERLEARHLDALLELVSREPHGTRTLDLPALVAVREYDSLTFRAASERTTGKVRQVFVSGPEPPYEIRRWRAGDRMRPVRLKGRSKKLADLFGDAKVPREARPLALVVARAGDGAIEWAEHLGPAWNSPVSVTLR